jgi:hypothetical protein
MSPKHRRPRRGMSRRALLGLAGLAAGSAAAVGAARYLGEGDTAADAHIVDPAASPSPEPTVVASARATPVTGRKDGPGGVVPFVEGKAWLGAYLDLKGMELPAALALRRRQTGRELKIVQTFHGWYDTIPTETQGMAADAYPMIAWRGTWFNEVTSGRSDKVIAETAKRLKQRNRPLLLRWAWEMNGNWYVWGPAKNGNKPDEFVASWRRIHDIFRDEGADNVSWVWSPNWNSSPNASWNSFDALYPGDEYVDWVGVSGYNLHREKPGDLYDGLYEKFSARKPFMIAEVGSVDRGGRTKADWLKLFSTWVDERPKVGAVVFFDTDTHPGTDEKWRLDSKETSLAAYAELSRTARFSA